jgi:Protein of unknown function (DUF1501)
MIDRLSELGRALAGFSEEIGAAGWRDTVVVVISEFGRTFRENGDRGTDYGHGSVYGLRAGTKLRLAYIRRARGALLAPISWPAALMPFLKRGLPSTQRRLESCGAKHGTALLSHQTSVGLTPHPNRCPLQSHRLFDDQTLYPNRRAVGFLFLQEILFGRKIGRLKKPKTGGCNMQSKIRIDQALPQPRQPRSSRPRQQ